MGWNACIQAQNLYVATTGRDNGPGSFADPYLTIQKAENNIPAGDTVFVRGGTYRNSTFNDGDIWDGDNTLNVTGCDGTAGNYTTFMPYNGEEVIIEFDDNYAILIQNVSYIKITGFTIKGIADQITQTEADSAWGWYKKPDDETVYDLAAEMGIDVSDYTFISGGGSAIDSSVYAPGYLPLPDGYSKPNYYNGRAIVANKAHHIDIVGNTIRDVPSAAIRAQQSDYVNISSNEVYSNTYWTTAGVGAITVSEATARPTGDTYQGVKIVLEKNTVYNNENRMISWNPTKSFVHFEIDEGTGLFLTRNWETYTHGITQISNNLSYNNGASGIVCHHTNDVVIEHNTVYYNGTTNHGLPGGIGVNYSDSVYIRNNISYARSDKWAIGILAQPVTNLVVESNLLYNDNGAQSIHRNISTGWSEADPLFVNTSTKDFKLTASSPAIDAGTSSATQTKDYDGTSRNDGSPDIGAYEFLAEQALPVELVQFSAKNVEEGVQLTWITESETENLGFIIERKAVDQTLNQASRTAKDRSGCPAKDEPWVEIASFVSHPDLEGQGNTTVKTEYAFVDDTILRGHLYKYRLLDVSYDGTKTFSGAEVVEIHAEDLIPQAFYLAQNYPNPFNAGTIISYELPVESHIKITLLDILGREVMSLVEETKPAGKHHILWDGSNHSGNQVPSGVYYCSFEAGGFTKTIKMVYLK